jgi:hypothetical protein
MPCRAPSWTGMGQTAVLGNVMTPATMTSAQVMGFNSIAPSITNPLFQAATSPTIVSGARTDLGRLTTVRQ